MTKPTKPSQPASIRFALRLPEDLHSRLQKAAQMSRRSLNSEILTLLEKALQTHS